ncbi:MAG: Spy/CpxP family protein refolding chaperone [Bdellovibrionota bacterium]|nr:MAG: Spy/CpxP family protein refolding chaperone [Bdellovibrionota bacterium]
MRSLLPQSVLSMLLLIAAVAYAQPEPPRFTARDQEGRGLENRERRPSVRGQQPAVGKHGGRFTPEFIKSLDLTAQQRRELLTLREEQRKLWQERAEIEADRRELRQLLKKQGASHADILEQFDKVQAEDAELQRRRLKNVLRLREILTPQQFRKVQERLEEFREQ